jgi:hypothetical protein
LPAYGFFVRHVEGLRLENIQLNFLSDDQRSAFIFDDVKGAELRFVKAETSGGVVPVSLKNSADVTVFQSLGMPDGKVK